MNPKEEIENKYILDLYSSVRVLEKEVKRNREEIYSVKLDAVSRLKQVESQNRLLKQELKAMSTVANIKHFIGTNLKKLKDFLDSDIGDDAWKEAAKIKDEMEVKKKKTHKK